MPIVPITTRAQVARFREQQWLDGGIVELGAKSSTRAGRTVTSRRRARTLRATCRAHGADREPERHDASSAHRLFDSALHVDRLLR